MSTTLIRPGILVSLKSTVSGGVSYERRDLEKVTAANGAVYDKWETEKRVDDPNEHARAVKARGDALSLIRKGLIHTAFGLLCPVDGESALNERRKQAKAIIDAFNGSSDVTRVSIFCLMGRIASTDEEAARAIGSEVASLVNSMNSAIDRLDPDAIRESANKARELSAMLDGEQAEKVGEAIRQARAAARAIVKRIGKEGVEAAVVLADIQRGALEKARIAFLDLDDAVPTGETMPVVSAQRVASLDVDDGTGNTIGEDGYPEQYEACGVESGSGEGEVLAAEAAQS